MSSNIHFPSNNSTSSTPVHHPRQPGPHSDSYFGHNSNSHSQQSSHSSHSSHHPHFAPLSHTPTKGHSRSTSNTSSFTPTQQANPSARSSMDLYPSINPEPASSSALTASATTPTTSNLRNHPGSINISNDYPHPDMEGPNDHAQQHEDHQNIEFNPGPPSPSTLTDTILGLHSTLYGGKRSAAQVEEMVDRYYESDAVFLNPLLAAHGRAQIANQFIMAFALPGMDVTSELRDVICSDFEFDGTRAGIIDQTITVTFLPTLFGSSTSSSEPSGGGYQAEYGPHHGYDASEYGPPFADGSSTPGYALQSGIPLHGPTTPHPFANYSSSSYPFTHSSAHTPAASGFARHGGHHGRMSQGHSPVTPFSVSGMWNNAPSSSRPHTPGWSSTMKPLSSSTGLPPNAVAGASAQFVTSEESGGGAAASGASVSDVMTRPAIPEDALKPHWSAGGLGRRTVHGLLWSIFHPREVLKGLCSIKLHLMSRLEFNDAGLIVRHEDMWGLREAIEGIVPFASTVYAIERRVAGLLVHWTIGKGFALSAALLRKALPGPNATQAEKSAYAIAQHEHEQQMLGMDQQALENGNHIHEQYHSKQQQRAGEAARALLSHRPPIPNAAGWQEGYQTISRSRAPSPTRYRWSTSSSNAGGTSTGRRSRTHSIGCPPYSRTVSSDNLVNYGQSHPHNASHALGSHSGNQASASMSALPLSANGPPSGIGIGAGGSSATESLPPDAGAKYRRKAKDERDRHSAEFDQGLSLNLGGEDRGRAPDRDY